MNYNFILDTNAYRILAKDHYLCEIVPFSNELRQREKKLNGMSYMCIVVSMELFRHFDETDPHFRDCFRALALQYFHTQSKSYGEANNQIEFIPPLNQIITKHFFNQTSSILKYFYKIIDIVNQITKDVEPLAFKEDADIVRNIGLVSKQLIHERVGLKDNFEDFLRSENNGVLDWTYFQKNAIQRKRLFGIIKSDKILDLFAVGLLDRAHKEMGYVQTKPGLESKLKEIRTFYEPFLRLSSVFFQKLLNGVEALADPFDPRWNTFNDMQVIAAACYMSHREQANNTKIILVTNDQGISNACIGTYMENNVWPLSRYLALLF